jgi:multisubunit Na+/H+ antiporter MnhB subunit
VAKKRRKKRKQAQESQWAPGTEPWLSKKTGYIVMGLVSLALAIFVTWTLSPGLGLGVALIWGLGFGIAMWGVFALALGFNRWIRGRR